MTMDNICTYCHICHVCGHECDVGKSYAHLITKTKVNPNPNANPNPNPYPNLTHPTTWIVMGM